MFDLPSTSLLALATAEPDPQPRPARRLLRRTRASQYLYDQWGIERSPATLAKYAVFGGGPKFHKAGRWPLYDPDELDRWAAELIGRPIASTSDHVEA